MVFRQSESNAPLRRYTRTCMFCGGPAFVLLPRGSDELDVEAEFCSMGRSFSDVEDGDPVGVGCAKCARKPQRQ